LIYLCLHLDGVEWLDFGNHQHLLGVRLPTGAWTAFSSVVLSFTVRNGGQIRLVEEETGAECALDTWGVHMKTRSLVL